jgi:molybdopterin molybdotransferase
MPEFLKLVEPQKALDLLLSHLEITPEGELISTREALGRITKRDVLSPHPLPEFRRSTVDGFAVKAGSTYGAGETLPAYLHLVGEVPMGGKPNFEIQEGQSAVIHTGGMLPEGADAVVMMEYTQVLEDDQVEIYRASAVGENVIEVGEDVRQNDVIVPAGIRLRVSEIGALMALGITELHVVRKPIVGILSSGDEVIPPDHAPQPGQVRDINSYTLAGIISEAGCQAVTYGIIPDNRQKMKDAIRKAHHETDLVIVTAGSSASSRDLTAELMDEMGEPGLLVHGVNIKPGKPTIFAVADGKPLIGLPGNPVSAYVIADQLVMPVLRKIQGLTRERQRPQVQAELSINVSSQTGRMDFVPVALTKGESGALIADPVFGKSNLIFVLVQADGLVKIPPDLGGLDAGATVNVLLF